MASQRGLSRACRFPRYLTTKLNTGIPALANEPIPLPYDLLGEAFTRLCEALAEGASGEATRLLATAAREKHLNVPPLLLLTLRREQGAIRLAATQAGLGHDLLWLVCDLTVGAFAHALLAPLFDHAELAPPLHSALAHWQRGYCPLCGSWPAFLECASDRPIDRAPEGKAETPAESRATTIGQPSGGVARCAFCAAAWDVVATSCIYCGVTGNPLVAITPDQARPARRVLACGSCRGYVKAVDARPLPFPLLPLTDLDSMDLDLVAMQAGFARPALKQFGRKR